MTSRPFNYEHRSEPLLSPAGFRTRLARHAMAAAAVIGTALAVGVLGYHYSENMPWLDSLLNASMILGGMGPVDALHTVCGKIFASFYALFSGIVFIAGAGIMIAPLAHRVLHRLHLESGKSKVD